MGGDPHPGIQLPQDWELIGFFECEPTLAYEGDADYGWQYNTLTFETTRGKNRVRCTIDPSYGELGIEWERDSIPLVQLRMCYGKRLTVHSDSGREYMRVTFDETSFLLPLILQLKPSVHIEWGATRWVQ